MRASENLLAAGLAKVTVPSDIGKIEDFFEGTQRQVVILIQDAHEIPDAQKNIQRLMDYFQKKYGIHFVGLEGADAPLDGRIFRSFPDKEALKKVFKDYQEKGELAAGVASAIFSGGHEMQWEGLEDWALYQRGVGLYLAAMKNEPKIQEQLRREAKRQEAEKQRIYPKDLLDLDHALELFYQNRMPLPEVLGKLAVIRPPEPGSELALLLKETGKRESDEALSLEVKRVAEVIKKHLQQASSRKPQEKVEARNLKLAAFNQQYQEFQTSRITPQAFGLYLKKLAAAERLPVKVSKSLSGSVHEQKRMEAIEGSKLFDDFEHYAEEVKASLFSTEEQKKLNAGSHELRLMERFSRLELSREDWEEIKKESQVESHKSQVTSPKSQGHHPEAFYAEGSSWLEDSELWSNHLAFYENAEQRDGALFKNLKKQMKGSAILVAGGFHAGGLTRRLKSEDISYLRLMPSISVIPEDTHYRDHMQGDVSWKDYLKPEKGSSRINLYNAFVRATRDKLLRGSGLEIRATIPDPHLLKQWRDQIILDLANQNQIERAGNYTSFLDELAPGAKPKEDLRARWFSNIDKFVEGMQGLKERNELTRENIAGLLNFAAVPTPVASAQIGAPAGKSFSFDPDLGIPADQTISLPQSEIQTIPSDVRSETRSAPETQPVRSEARKKFGDLTPRQQAALHLIEKQEGVIDPETVLYQKLAPIVSKTLETFGLPSKEYGFIISDSDEVDAYYSLDNKLIVISYGLLKFLRNNEILDEDTIIFIIGHEIGHAAIEQKKKADEKYRPSALTEEYMADVDYGLAALEAAGRSPYAGARLMEAFRKSRNQDAMIWLTKYAERSTHPPIHRRQVNIREHIRRLKYWSHLDAPRVPIPQSDFDAIDRSGRQQFDEGLYSNFSLRNIAASILRAVSLHDLLKLINLFNIFLDYKIGLQELLESRKRGGSADSGMNMDLSEENISTYTQAVLLHESSMDQRATQFIQDEKVNIYEFFTGDEIKFIKKVQERVVEEQRLAGKILPEFSEEELLTKILSRFLTIEYWGVKEAYSTSGGVAPFSLSFFGQKKESELKDSGYSKEKFRNKKAAWYEANSPLHEPQLRRQVRMFLAENSPNFENLSRHDRDQLIDHFILAGLEYLNNSPTEVQKSRNYLENLHWDNPLEALSIFFENHSKYENEYLKIHEDEGAFRAMHQDDRDLITTPNGNIFYFRYVDAVIKGLMKTIREQYENGQISQAGMLKLYEVFQAYKKIVPDMIGNHQQTEYGENITSAIMDAISNFEDLIPLLSKYPDLFETIFPRDMQGWVKAIKNQEEAKRVLEFFLSQPDKKNQDLVIDVLPAMIRKMLEFEANPEKMIQYLDELLARYGLEKDWIDEDYNIGSMRTKRPVMYARAYAEALSLMTDLNSRLPLILEYFKKYNHTGREISNLYDQHDQPDDYLIRLFQSTLEAQGMSERQQFDVFLANGLLPLKAQVLSIPQEERHELFNQMRMAKQNFLNNRIAEEDLNAHMARMAWMWFFDAFSTATGKKSVTSLAGRTNGKYNPSEDLVTHLVSSETNQYRLKNLKEKVSLDPDQLTDEDFETLFSLMNSMGKPRYPSMKISEKKHVRSKDFKDKEQTHQEDYDSEKSKYRGLLTRYEEELKYAEDIKLGDWLYDVWLKKHPNANIQDKLQIILKVFPYASLHRNSVILNLIQSEYGSPLEMDALKLDELLFPEGQEVILADSHIRDVLARRAIEAKRGQKLLKADNYQQIKELVERYFSEDSLIKDEVMHQLLQKALISIDELNELKGEGPHEQAAKDRKKKVGHAILELVADEIENFEVEDKLAFFEWLIGVQRNGGEKPVIVKYLEYEYSVNLDDTAKILNLASEAERYAFLSTLFIGPQGILNNKEVRKQLLGAVYAQGLGSAGFEDLPDSEKEKDMLFVIFEALFEESSELKQLDLTNGIFKHFLKHPGIGNASNKNFLIREMLISFGVVGIKLGQILSRNNLITDEELKKVLEGLSDGVDPLDKRYLLNALLVDHSLDEIKKEVNVIGPLLGSASVKQGYKSFLMDAEGNVISEKALKFIRPMAPVEVEENMEILEKVLDRLKPIAERVPELEALKKALEMLSTKLLGELKKAISREMNMAAEIEAQESIAQFLNGFAMDGWTVEVPGVDQDLNGAKFFADDFVYGEHPKTQMQKEMGEEAYNKLAKVIFAGIARQMLLHNRFHADLHPGNIMVNVKTKKIYFMDFGNTATLSSQNQDSFIQLLAALDSGSSKTALEILGKMVETGSLQPEINEKIRAIVQGRASPEIKLRQIKSALDEASITFSAEFEILFKVFETITYLTDSLDYSEKKAIFKSIILKRQLTLSRFFSATTLSVLRAEAASWFSFRSETRSANSEDKGKAAPRGEWRGIPEKILAFVSTVMSALLAPFLTLARRLGLLKEEPASMQSSNDLSEPAESLSGETPPVSLPGAGAKIDLRNRLLEESLKKGVMVEGLRQELKSLLTRGEEESGAAIQLNLAARDILRSVLKNQINNEELIRWLLEDPDGILIDLKREEKAAAKTGLERLTGILSELENPESPANAPRFLEEDELNKRSNRLLDLKKWAEELLSSQPGLAKGGNLLPRIEALDEQIAREWSRRNLAGIASDTKKIIAAAVEALKQKSRQAQGILLQDSTPEISPATARVYLEKGSGYLQSPEWPKLLNSIQGEMPMGQDAGKYEQIAIQLIKKAPETNERLKGIAEQVQVGDRLDLPTLGGVLRVQAIAGGIVTYTLEKTGKENRISRQELEEKHIRSIGPSNVFLPAAPRSEARSLNDFKQSVNMESFKGLALSKKTNKPNVSENQDAAEVVNLGKGVVLALVADGMGGLPNAASASALAKNVIIKTLTEVAGKKGISDIEKGASLLTDAVRLADSFFSEKSFKGAGTTLSVVLMFPGGEFVVVAVGDSPVFIKRANGRLEKLTKEESLARIILDARTPDGKSHIEPADYEHHPARNRLLNYLGITDEEGVKKDIKIEEGKNLIKGKLQPGDMIVLGSDGVFDPLSYFPDEINYQDLDKRRFGQLMTRAKDPASLAQNMMQETQEIKDKKKDVGEYFKDDDATLIALQYQPASPAEPKKKAPAAASPAKARAVKSVSGVIDSIAENAQAAIKALNEQADLAVYNQKLSEAQKDLKDILDSIDRKLNAPGRNTPEDRLAAQKLFAVMSAKVPMLVQSESIEAIRDFAQSLNLKLKPGQSLILKLREQIQGSKPFSDELGNSVYAALKAFIADKEKELNLQPKKQPGILHYLWVKFHGETEARDNYLEPAMQQAEAVLELLTRIYVAKAKEEGKPLGKNFEDYSRVFSGKSDYAQLSRWLGDKLNTEIYRRSEVRSDAFVEKETGNQRSETRETEKMITPAGAKTAIADAVVASLAVALMPEEVRSKLPPAAGAAIQPEALTDTMSELAPEMEFTDLAEALKKWAVEALKAASEKSPELVGMEKVTGMVERGAAWIKSSFPDTKLDLAILFSKSDDPHRMQNLADMLLKLSEQINRVVLSSPDGATVPAGFTESMKQGKIFFTVLKNLNRANPTAATGQAALPALTEGVLQGDISLKESIYKVGIPANKQELSDPVLDIAQTSLQVLVALAVAGGIESEEDLKKPEKIKKVVADLLTQLFGEQYSANLLSFGEDGQGVSINREILRTALTQYQAAEAVRSAA